MTGLSTYFARRRAINRTKNKTGRLNAILRSRGIPGRIFYSRSNGGGKICHGWFHMLPRENDVPQLLGASYADAVEMIENGTLDFIKGWKSP